MILTRATLAALAAFAVLAPGPAAAEEARFRSAFARDYLGGDCSHATDMDRLDACLALEVQEGITAWDRARGDLESRARRRGAAVGGGLGGVVEFLTGVPTGLGAVLGTVGGGVVGDVLRRVSSTRYFSRGQRDAAHDVAGILGMAAALQEPPEFLGARREAVRAVAARILELDWEAGVQTDDALLKACWRKGVCAWRDAYRERIHRHHALLLDALAAPDLPAVYPAMREIDGEVPAARPSAGVLDFFKQNLGAFGQS